MQTVNDNQKANDSEWYFLAEFSLSEFSVDEDLGDDLFQNIRVLGMPSGNLKQIEKSVRVFAKEAMAHFFYEKIVLRIYIRLFNSKETAEGGNPADTLKGFCLDQTVEPLQLIYHPDTLMEGGWGYFVIKRGNDSSPGSFVNSHNLVDLYLYREGE